MLFRGSFDNTIKLWNINSGREIRTFEGHTWIVNSVTFSPDGKYALSGSIDNTLRFWDINSGKEIRTFTGYSDGVFSIAFLCMANMHFQEAEVFLGKVILLDSGI